MNVSRADELKCKGRAITKTGSEEVKVKGEHSHAGDARELPVRVVKEVLKDVAKNSHTPIKSIIGGALTEITSNAVLMALPKKVNMAQNMRNARKKEDAEPPLPATIDELELVGKYTQTLKDEPFLLADQNENGVRTLTFTTEANITYLLSCAINIHFNDT